VSRGGRGRGHGRGGGRGHGRGRGMSHTTGALTLTGRASSMSWETQRFTIAERAVYETVDRLQKQEDIHQFHKDQRLERQEELQRAKKQSKKDKRARQERGGRDNAGSSNSTSSSTFASSAPSLSSHTLSPVHQASSAPILPTQCLPVTQSSNAFMDLDDTLTLPFLGNRNTKGDSVQDISNVIDNLLKPALMTEGTDGLGESEM
jgi:hypothetical protein